MYILVTVQINAVMLNIFTKFPLGVNDFLNDLFSFGFWNCYRFFKQAAVSNTVSETL